MNNISPEFIDAMIVALLILAACIIGLIANAIVDGRVAKRTNRILATYEAITRAVTGLERKVKANVNTNVVNAFRENQNNGKK